MERLTRRLPNGKVSYAPLKDGECVDIVDLCNVWGEKLATYEDAEEQGRVVVLPCKPSDVTVYQLRNKKHARGVGISPRHISSATVWADGNYSLSHQGADDCLKKDLGKTWFLTYEEAEKALGRQTGMAEYIEREALTEARKCAIQVYENANIFNALAIRKGLKPLLDAIVDVPAADVAPVVHGQWIYEYGDEFSETYKCGACGHKEEICVEMFRELLPCYCPSCGAKMQEAR